MQNRYSEPVIERTADEARQGPKGRRVLMMLIAALILAAIAWAGVEFYGESIDPPSSPETGQTTSQPNRDATPSDTPAQPNVPTDRNPAPQSGTGGATQSNPQN